MEVATTVACFPEGAVLEIEPKIRVSLCLQLADRWELKPAIPQLHEVLEEMVEGTRSEFILESDRVHWVRPAEVRAFWKDWAANPTGVKR